MNLRTIAVGALLAVTAVGCKHYNYKASGVLPKQNEEFAVTTTSNSEADALDGVRREGEKHCGKASKQFMVVSGPESKYQGPERSGGLGLGAVAANKIFGRDSSQDYKAEMVFKCH